MSIKIFIEQLIDDIHNRAHMAATSPYNELKEPSEKQIRYGNYKKGHIHLNGMRIAIENPIGSKRRGVDENGSPWESELKHHYGYIKGTTDSDGDHIDTFIGDNPESKFVYIINQNKKDGSFDEHKIMMGFANYSDALNGYLKNYPEDWEGQRRIDSVHCLPLDAFREWAFNSRKRRKFRGLP